MIYHLVELVNTFPKRGLEIRVDTSDNEDREDAEQYGPFGAPYWHYPTELLTEEEAVKAFTESRINTIQERIDVLKEEMTDTALAYTNYMKGKK